MAEQHGILVVPMCLIFGGRAVADRDLSTDELLARLPAGDVSTSWAVSGDFATVISEALERADEVLVLTLSAGMSSTHASAELAARLSSGLGSGHRHGHRRRGRGPRRPRRGPAGGRGRVDRRGRGDRAPGPRAVIDRVHLVATVDDLEHARCAAGGYRPSPVGPRTRCGSGRSSSSVTGRCTCWRRRWGERAGSPPHPRALPGRPAPHRRAQAPPRRAGRPGPPDRARALLDDVLAEVPDADWFIGPFGPVMLVHVGAGVSGLAWWWEDPPSTLTRAEACG